MSGPRPGRRLLGRLARRGAVALGVLAVLLAVAAAGGAWLAVPWWQARHVEAHALIEAHLTHSVAHPGWSFPARVWSASAPLDLPPERLVVQARARGYTEVCPALNPGEMCAQDGTALPRDGGAALESVLVAVLVGPDGEIREHLPLEAAPPHLIAALLASEDAGFREHGGVDLFGSARALAANLQGGGYQQGGSTLTMQVVRNLDQRRERSLERKIREMALAVHVDAALGKDGVLGLYLDLPYLGQEGSYSICGFRAASKYYFDKDATELDLAEAALLVGMLPAPGRFAPDLHPQAARAQRDRVLRRLAETGWDPDEVARALDAPIAVTRTSLLPPVQHPAYVSAVRDRLEAELGTDLAYGVGLDVHTALDLVAQRASERVLSEKPASFQELMWSRVDAPLLAAGALLDPHTGRLVAVYGGPMALPTDLNRATGARRQPGSTAKPLTYLLALSARDADGARSFDAAHLVPNAWRRFDEADGWAPKNVGGEYAPAVTVSYALAASQNVATVELMERSGGPEAVRALAAKMGLDTSAWPDEYGLAIGQGEASPLEMAVLVATIVNGGRKVDPSPIVEARDRSGTVRIRHAGLGPQVVEREAAALVRELMHLAATFGTAAPIFRANGEPGVMPPAIGKTGTTDQEKDLWLVGATPWFAGAVWLGYDEPAPIGASASDLAAPLWGWWVRAASEGLPKKDFAEIVPLQRAWTCSDSGRLAVEGCRSLPAPFLPGTAPHVACPGGHVHAVGRKEPYVSLWRRLEADQQAAAALREAPVDGP